jgi:hypothetical protein
MKILKTIPFILVLLFVPFFIAAQSEEDVMQAAGYEEVVNYVEQEYITIKYKDVSYYYGKDAIKKVEYDGNLKVMLQDNSGNTTFTYYLEQDDHYIEYVNVRRNIIARINPWSMPSLRHEIGTDRLTLFDVIIDQDTADRIEIYLNIALEVEE